MNKKYIVTGKASTITFEFDPDGNLLGIQANEPVSTEQWKFIFQHLPQQESLMEVWKARFTNVKVEMAKPYSFEDYWNAYGYKIDKAKAQAEWNKLSEQERFLAVRGIKKYNAYLERTKTAKRYPERYLKNKSWENEY